MNRKYFFKLLSLIPFVPLTVFGRKGPKLPILTWKNSLTPDSSPLKHSDNSFYANLIISSNENYRILVFYKKYEDFLFYWSRQYHSILEKGYKITHCTESHLCGLRVDEVIILGKFKSEEIN